MTCAALSGLALLRCLAADPACLPPEHRPLLPVLVSMSGRESGHRDWALRDETTGESLFFRSREEAVAAALARRARGHVLGYGRFQITREANLRRHGLTPETAFDPCRNLRAAAAHLAAGIKGYNGSGPAADRYAASVIARVRDGDTDAAPVPAPDPATPSAPACAAPSWDAWAQAACATPRRPRRTRRTAEAETSP